ncbi:MAG TPA: N-acetylmuramoyl-L-alanine amidase, partial [Bacteroidetes bacterium]|nr:N-acetylmuramoyl-L-alanine amidase [Bacteroidota bacterium]
MISASAVVILVQACLVISVTPEINVVYPRPMKGDSIAHIARVDSNFIFGSVEPPDARLFINHHPVPLYENGAFLAFLPVDWDGRCYDLQAIHDVDVARLDLPFDAYPPAEPPVDPGLSFPRLLELTGGVARTDPDGAYYVFPAPGTVALSVDWRRGYYRLPLADCRAVWISGRFVNDAGPAATLKPPVLWRGSVEPAGKWVKITLPVHRKVLFRAWESTDPDRIILELYNIISHIDRIDYAPGTEPVREVTWDQPADGVVRIEVSLSTPCWGYKTVWSEGALTLMVRKPPALDHGVGGLVIALDPGHGGDDFGAIGPTGLTEKEANLRAALKLAQLLRRKGAKVVLTRSDDSPVGLVERIGIAEEAGADLLISLHHNALPDGVNPFGDIGTGSYYYRPQSRILTQSIQKELVKRLRFYDEGV